MSVEDDVMKIQKKLSKMSKTDGTVMRKKNSHKKYFLTFFLTRTKILQFSVQH
jgi:hypothetical protein